MKDYIEKEIAIENSSLKEVWISNRYVMVPAGVFNNSSSIASINIPNPVKRICNCAFRNCKELTTINLPDSLRSIGQCAFMDCRKLESITLPRNANEISSNAFLRCRNLKSVTIHGSNLPVFSGCRFISSITIGENLQVFDSNAFLGCKHIKSIVVDENNTHYDSRNNCNAIIETSSNTLILGCNTSKIPDGVKHISKRAFADCGRMKNISLPNSLESIGSLPSSIQKIFIPKGTKDKFRQLLPRKKSKLIEK